MTEFFRVLGFVLLVGGSFEALGFLSHELDRALSVVGLAVFAATFAGDLAATRWPGRRTALAAGLCFLTAFPLAHFAPAGMAAFHLLVLAGLLLLCARAPLAASRELQAYALALCLVLLVMELVRLSPLVWHFQQGTAATLSALAGRLAREPRNLGPTAMGLPLLGALVAIVLARSTLVPIRCRPRAWIAIVALALAHVSYLVLLTPFARMARHMPGREALLLNSQWLWVLIGTTVLAILNTLAAWRGRRAPVVEAVPEPMAWRRRLADPRLVSGFSLGILLVLVLGKPAPPDHVPAEVMLYDAGLTSWQVPHHGEYGENSAGMFGLLPMLLQAAGHRVERSTDLRRLDGPEAPDCLILANIQKYLEPVDKERVLRFVARGGGLLCLGDHTGVAGIRGPFNDLLQPTGIAFEFDSATFFASGWTNALEHRTHPLNCDLENDEDYQLWVGASLAVAPSVAPVVVARYGWSDLGDMANLQRAYLGDRRYNPEELLGDLVLVAEAAYGHGKVLVFGDTSGYQNLSLPRSAALVLRSIDHLGTPGAAPRGVRLQLAVLAIFALCLGLVTGAGAWLPPVGAVCAGLLLASAVAAGMVRPQPTPPLDWSRVTPASLSDAIQVPLHGTALVDRSHGGRYDLRAWNDTSIGGLTLNLMRDGFFPILSERFPATALESADVMVLVAPQRAFSRREREVLRRFMDRGGRLIVSVGYEELDGARTLLADYGLGVREIPLAQFRTGPNKEDLVFTEGWALECPPAARVLVRQWGMPVVAQVAVGRGSLTTIGDSFFFLDRNLEGLQKWFPGNIALLTALAQNRPLEPIEGKYGDPRQPAALADAPATAAHPDDGSRP